MDIQDLLNSLNIVINTSKEIGFIWKCLSLMLISAVGAGLFAVTALCIRQAESEKLNVYAKRITITCETITAVVVSAMLIIFGVSIYNMGDKTPYSLTFVIDMTNSDYVQLHEYFHIKECQEYQSPSYAEISPRDEYYNQVLEWYAKWAGDPFSRR